VKIPQSASWVLPVAGPGQDGGVIQSPGNELAVDAAVVDGASHRSVVDSLRNAIITGELASGTRLIEDVLAEQFGVSRVPIREALRQLESEGFVSSERYRGATVSSTSTRDTLELMQVRRGLEVLAARQAAEHRGEPLGDELRSVVAGGQEAGRQHQVDRLPPLIMEFHEVVAKASGNRQLQQMLHRVLQRIAWGFEMDIEDRIDSSWADHSAVALAILSGSPVQAGYLMDEHIRKDEDLYRQKTDIS
jgi:DNA-binding GntR family transcriptional regulator